MVSKGILCPRYGQSDPEGPFSNLEMARNGVTLGPVQPKCAKLEINGENINPNKSPNYPIR